MANRPNFFVALQITDENVLRETGQFQQSIFERDPMFRDSFIPSNKLHITLCCMNLRGQNEIDRCVQILQNITGVLSDKLRDDKTICFQGIGHFEKKTSVVYVKCRYPKRVEDMVKYLRWRLGKEGVNMCWSGFLPHLTLMKLTGSVRRNTGLQEFPPWIYQNKEELNFGSQQCNNIHLYKMQYGNDVDYECFYYADL